MQLSTIILIILGIMTAAFAIVFVMDYLKCRRENALEPTHNFIFGGITGFIANFFDTLGIGSFAPTTAMLRAFKAIEDRKIPGTLNAACTIPVVLEAFIFIKKIEVEPVTLVGMLVAATLGALVGASFVSKLDEKKVQLYMAIALLCVGVIMVFQLLGIFPSGGEAIGLTGVKLVVGILINFVLGALMTIGIGLYAPCMALVLMLGMSPAVAFPIMMGSCAYLMPVASIKFVKEGAYDRQVTLATIIFGSIGVFIAAYIVTSLPLTVLKWLVVCVIVYTSVSLYMASQKKKNAAR